MTTIGIQHRVPSEGILTAFIRRHAALAYFVLCFAISWGCVLAVIVPSGLTATPEQRDRLFPWVYLAMLTGPSIAGVVMTGIVRGKVGLREFLARLLRWRVGARWYAVALLTAPVAAVAVLLIISLRSPEFLPGVLTSNDWASRLMFGLAVGVGAGVFEELGWTGFATPVLRPRYGMLATGLLVGVLWGAWHFLVNVWGSGSSSGALSMDLLLPSLLFSVAILPADRVVMVWVHERTASLLVAMLMHASLTASSVMFMPAAVGTTLLIYDAVLAGLLIVVAAFVARVAWLAQ